MRACVCGLTTQRLGDLTAPLLVILQIACSLLVDLYRCESFNENITGEEAGCGGRDRVRRRQRLVPLHPNTGRR